MTDRADRQAWFRDAKQEADVVVIGAGVVGASIYHRLSAEGYRVVLVDQHDLGSGASQGSANLVWGGLLYLARGRVDEVWRWSHERDRLLADATGGVRRMPCAYRLDPSRRSPTLIRAALLGYWALAGCHGPLPRTRDGHLWFREGLLEEPDARRTWSLVAGTCQPGLCLTWCRPTAIHAAPGGAGWTVTLADQLDGLSATIACPLVINAAGAWAGRVDALAGIDHGWDIVPSRGVSLVVEGRRDHALMVDHPTQEDMLSLVPFPGADASIWGSTETLVADAETALQPADEDLAELIRLHRQLVGPLDRRRLLGVRCGVRALAVRRGAAARRSQDLTRSFRVLAHGAGWITILGGKLTGARAIAATVAARVARRLGRRNPGTPPPAVRPPTLRLPGLHLDLPDPAWCRDHEQCWTLACWLRRRTPLAQVVPRGGLGWEDEHLPQLAGLADRLLGEAGPAALAAHVAQVAAEDARLDGIFDRLDADAVDARMRP